MNPENPEKLVPIPDWYAKKALPILKKMWRDFINKKIEVDTQQSNHYNSVLPFEKIKKTNKSREVYENVEMPFGSFLFAFFGFKIEFEDGQPCVSESSLEKIKEAIKC